MLTIIEANGSVLKTDMTVTEFQTSMALAAPSSWISIDETSLGTIYLNIFTIAYYYEA